jgi:lincosamide nucleotidyltransferase A/C/D/E
VAGVLTATDAAALCRQLAEHRVGFWLIGGWGVDALLHRQTRPHKDLDVLVRLADLGPLRRLLDEHGFTRTLVWEESRWVEEPDGPWPTAFVATDPAGRALDVHLVDVQEDGRVVQLYDAPWPLPRSLDGTGTIDGTDVPCVSVPAQRALHTGYELPDGHRQDLDLLRDLT